jgi:hypothetical protein
MTAGGLELLVESPQFRGCTVEIGCQSAELVTVRHLHPLGEITLSDLSELHVHACDWPNERPRECVA